MYQQGVNFIGLHGLQGAGKDSFAGFIVYSLRNTGRRCVSVAMAQELYAEASAAFGVSPSFLAFRNTKNTELPDLRLRHCTNGGFVALCVSLGMGLDSFLSPRRLLQLWGTEFRRAQQPDYWIRRHESYLSHLHLRPGDVVLVPDIRRTQHSDDVTEAVYLQELANKAGTKYRLVHIVGRGEGTGHTSDVPLPEDMITTFVHNDADLGALSTAADEYVLAEGLLC